MESAVCQGDGRWKFRKNYNHGQAVAKSPPLCYDIQKYKNCQRRIVLSIAFRHPTLEDRDWITDLYHKSGYRGCEASFVNLYLWGRGYGQIARVNDYLIQFIKMGDVKYYAYPAGSGDLKPVIDALIDDAREYGHQL